MVETGSGFPSRLRTSHQSRRLNTSYRRNGKLQSCEPCRKGKLRCDHMMPTCGRCARRNKPDQCVYHPAPLTKNASIPTPQPSEDTDHSSPTTVFQPQAFNTASVLAIFNPPEEEVTSQPPRHGRTHEDATAQPPRFVRASSLPAQLDPSSYALEELRSQKVNSSDLFQKRAAFVSHSAILYENEATIGVDLTLDVAQDAEAHHREKYRSASHIQRGAGVLTVLKDLPTIEKYIDKWFSFTRGSILVEPMVKMWTTGAWSSYRHILERQKPEELLQLSEKICQNTLKPLEMTQHTTPREFAAMTTGEGLRWEVVGLILSLVGMLGHCLQNGDPIFCSHDDPPVDRHELTRKMSHAAEICVEFCNSEDIMNDLYLWLLLCSTMVANNLRSKGSYVNWQKSTYLIQAVIAFGLHQEIKVDAQTPFFMTEFRKRLFITCYEDDKFTASFVGRPPRLTRHYSLLQLPLDLNDAQLMSDGLDLQAALSSLDDSGWNRRGAIQCCTLSRIFASNAVILEEILEISLGVLSPEDIVSRAADIERRAIQIYTNLPAFLRVDESNPWDRRRAPVESLFLAYIRLADLYHHFLLQRTLIKKAAQADSAKMLNAALDLFRFMQVLVYNRDSLRDFHLDFVQMLCMYGIPSAAVVAVELLKQEQEQLNHIIGQEGENWRFDLAQSANGSATKVVLPRSETIQELSVFVACLATIQPDSCAFANCDRGRKFLKRVLDTVLSPLPRVDVGRNVNPVGAPSVPGSFVFGTGVLPGMYVGDGTEMDMPLFQTGDNDGDLTRWLETMEWDSGGAMTF